MRRTKWSIALLAVIACVVGVRYALRSDGLATSVQPLHEKQSAQAPRDHESFAIANHATESPSGVASTASSTASREAVQGEPIEGFVYGAPGTRLENADVALFQAAAGTETISKSLQLLERTRSDADGRFKFIRDWAPDLRITASIEGYDEASITPELDCTARIVLQQHLLRATVRGRIETSRGSPAASCAPTFEVEDRAHRSMLESPETKLAEDGTFELSVPLSDAEPVRAAVWVRCRRCRGGGSGEFNLAPDALIDGIVIQLEEASAMLRGLVLDENGASIADAVIQGVAPARANAPLTFNNDDGTFELPLFEPDLLTALVANADEYASTYVALPPPSNRGDVVIVRMSRGATVTGRVLDARGVGGAVHVWCSATRHENREAIAQPYWVDAASVDADGKYTIEHVPFGAVQIWISLSREDWNAGERAESLSVESATVLKDFFVQ